LRTIQKEPVEEAGAGGSTSRDTSLQVVQQTQQTEQELESIYLEGMKEKMGNEQQEKKDQVELERIMIQEVKPAKQILIAVVIWFIVSFFSFLRGGSGAKSIAGFTKCSSSYWITTLMSFVTLTILKILIGKWISNYTFAKKKLGWMPEEGEIDWTPDNCMYEISVATILLIVFGNNNNKLIYWRLLSGRTYTFFTFITWDVIVGC
jgi:hypothetical protein